MVCTAMPVDPDQGLPTTYADDLFGLQETERTKWRETSLGVIPL